MSKNGKLNVYKIRLSTPFGNRTVIVHALDQKKAASKVKIKGRILSVTKVTFQELFGIGDDFVKRMLDPTYGHLTGKSPK